MTTDTLTVQDLIEWDGDTAVLPDDAHIECDNPYDWRPLDGDTLPQEDDRA